jgi:hypothetical protein
LYENHLRILVVLIGLFVLLVVSLNVSIYFQKRSVPEMTPEKAQKIFETAGGIDEVNREAKALFDKLGTNDWTFLYPEDLTNSPAVFFLYSSLKSYSGGEYSGTRVAIWPDHDRYLEIRFGNHWVGKEMFVFDPSSTNAFYSPSNWYQIPWFQISSNIFGIMHFTKGR